MVENVDRVAILKQRKINERKKLFAKLFYKNPVTHSQTSFSFYFQNIEAQNEKRDYKQIKCYVYISLFFNNYTLKIIVNKHNSSSSSSIHMQIKSRNAWKYEKRTRRVKKTETNQTNSMESIDKATLSLSFSLHMYTI